MRVGKTRVRLPASASAMASAGSIHRVSTVSVPSWRHTVEDAMGRARASKVVTVQPVLEERPEGKVLCIPAEADYDVTEIAFDKVPRANFPGA